MKKHYLLIFTILPFLLGFFIALSQKPVTQSSTDFNITNIVPADKIVLTNRGDIYELTENNINRITTNQNLIEPVSVGSSFAGINKTTNYSSLVLYSSGNSKTLFSGNSSSLETMSWISDPNVNPAQNRIAYVSDKDKNQTNVPDNSLYVLNLDNGKSTNIANPAPYSGGIAHPVFDPVDGNIILYDYYQYDPDTQVPYSTIEEFNNKTGTIKTLTFENKNAYQESISPDGKQVLFLGRQDSLNTVTLFIADFDKDSGISDIHPLLTGDLAYPVFSNTKSHIYYLLSEGNKGYNLVTAVIKNKNLVKMQTVVGGFQLLGNSSYSVVK